MLWTDTICLLFLSSDVFTALEFDSNHFDVPLWEILKPCDQNEIKPPMANIFRKNEPIRHYFTMSRKQFLRLFVNNVYDNYNNVSYPQKNKKCYNLETTFQKNVNFSQKLIYQKLLLDNFPSPYLCYFNLTVNYGNLMSPAAILNILCMKIFKLMLLSANDNFASSC